MSLEVLLQAAEYIERKEREMEHGYASTLPMPECASSLARYKNNNLFSNFNSHKPSRRTRSKTKLINNRTIHNELEKNRRAHLRTCLEKLKELVPLGSDGSRHTTLGLLTKAKQFIKNLELQERKHQSLIENMKRKHLYNRRKLDLLARDVNLMQREEEDDEDEDEEEEEEDDSSSSFDDSAVDLSSDSALLIDDGEYEDGDCVGDGILYSSSSIVENRYSSKRRSVSESSGFSTESSNSSSGTSLSESDEIDILGPPSGDDSDEVSSNRSSFSLSSDGSVVISTRRLTLKEEIMNAKTLSL